MTTMKENHELNFHECTKGGSYPQEILIMLEVEGFQV
jgi:hypothetical protein